jgi:hypothetical protein
MGENVSVAVSNNWTKAKVDLAIMEHADGKLREASGVVTAKQARKIALRLLDAAEKAEEQREQNLRQLKQAVAGGYVGDAVQIAKDNEVSEEELDALLAGPGQDVLIDLVKQGMK